MRTPVISLGAGVQSSAMLLMAAEGRFGVVPELAIFSDTLHEPAAVYEHLDWLEAQVRGRIEIVRVSAGDLLAVAQGRKFNPIPLYLRNPDGTSSIGRRQCTKEFKLYPIRHELRRRGLDPVEMWVGISLDESLRMKPSGLKWIENRWPLVEHRISRRECLSWFEARYPGRSLAKSACVFCPYKRDRDWSEMREQDPESFARAVAADEAMRDAGDGREQFVSSSLVPLLEVRTPEDDGQSTIFDFMDECEGMCGV
jgi:hypothetical protein